MKFEVTFKGTVEVPDDNVIWIDTAGAGRVIDRQTLEPAVPEGFSLGEWYRTGALVIAPDPDQQEDYDVSIADAEEKRRNREMKRLLGVPEDELLTDEQIDHYIEDEPDLTFACGNCGSSEIQYHESEYQILGLDDDASKVDGDGNGTLYFQSGHRGDGDGYPGPVCGMCNSVLEVPDSIDIDWSF